MKKYIVEMLGTGALTLAVGLSIAGSFPVSTPVLAALTLGLFVYSVGHISGAHMNPAVTAGLWSIGKIAPKEAVFYAGAQVCGAGVVLLFLNMFAPVSTMTVDGNMMVGVAELLGAFFFTFGIASVVYGKIPGQMHGVMIGGSLLLGISIAVGLGSNGVLNPAVALGIGSFGVMYMLGPVVGAVLGMQAYKYLQE